MGSVGELGPISRMRRRRRRTVHVEKELVDVAPPPVLTWFVRTEYRVIRMLMPVRSRVPVRGVVAAADVPTTHTEPQVHPISAHPEAVLTAPARRFDGLDGIEMSALRSQGIPSFVPLMLDRRRLRHAILAAQSGPWLRDVTGGCAPFAVPGSLP